MNGVAWIRLALVLLVAGAAGCRTAPTPSGTGAREVVDKFFDALAREDWHAAYAQLHSTTRARWDQPTFEQRALEYRKQLGFPISKVHIRSCDEQGEKAIAQLTLTDAAGSAKNRYREGAVLEKEADGWRIVLTNAFGHGSK